MTIQTKVVRNKIIIAGPCALESRELMLETVQQAKAYGVDYVRLSLWKPRTKPGYEGLGEKGIPLLVEAAKMGANPAFEPLMPSHAEKAVKEVLPVLGNGKLLIWLGARNQNHVLQKEIAQIAAQDPRIMLMVKNQCWHNEKHWEGIIEHVLESGIRESNLLICHRGFSPIGSNPHEYRNVPDWDMAMRMKEKTGLPMLFDPSHTAGNVPNVKRIFQEAQQYPFDGYIIEVHPTPKHALTDQNQQITWKEFGELLAIKKNKISDAGAGLQPAS